MSVRKILVGVDGSAGSGHAIEWAAGLAEDLKADVVAVHVYEPLGHLGDIGPGVSLADVRDQLADELADIWCEPFHRRNLAVDRRIAEGTPHEAILDIAEETEADLIVLGARRMGPLKAAALGSTSIRVVHDAVVPVTIVHGNGDETPR